MITKKTLALVSFTLITSTPAFADKSEHKHKLRCPVSWQQLNSALATAVDTSAPGTNSNGGFGLNMWATVVNTEGKVCQVTKSGTGINDQWLGSRVISAQKANTANAFSLQSNAGDAFNGLALSTANLWKATQPGGSLFGLQFSNPVDTKWAYHGNKRRFGTRRDPMRGRRVGGVNVFGGGLALYNEEGRLVGAVGVSGDSSCADHNIAWRVRDALGLDYVPVGVADVPANGDESIADNIIYNTDHDFGHTSCDSTIPGFDGMHDEEAANAAIIAACPPRDGTTPGCESL